jgi:uncharacterized membrane protein YfcA
MPACSSSSTAADGRAKRNDVANFDYSLLADAMADRRFWLAFAISALSGLVRGFSGFGSAMIYMPLIAAIYDPRVAAVTLLLIDTLSTAPITIGSFGRCAWREIVPMFAACALAIPFGAMALVAVDPVLLRWFMACTVFVLLGVLMTGWRYHGTPTLPMTLAVGAYSGFSGGAVQIAGPPVVLYWLGSGNDVATLRANLLVYFLLMDIALCVVYAAKGLFTAELVMTALVLAVPFLVMVGAGVYLFRGTSDALYRRVAYAIIALSALVSLPLLDPWLR